MSMAETPTHFFTVVPPSALEDKRLEIPENFSKKFGDELSALATLRLPNGRVWHVGLIKRGRKIWFQDGWHDFIEYHSISAGYYLFFRYEKNSNFHVLIFDMTACEIVYPRYYGPGNDVQNSVHEDETKTDDSVEIKGPATPNPPFSSVKKEISDDWPSGKSSNKLFTPSKLGGAKRSVSSALATSKCWESPASLESPNFEHAYETNSKKCKVEELVETYESDALNESSQGKLKRNEMHNTEASLHYKGHLGESAETEFKTATHRWEDDDPAEVLGNQKIADIQELFSLLVEKQISVSQRFGDISSEERERTINVARMLKPKNPSFMVILRSRNIANGFLYMPVHFAHKCLSRDVKLINLQVLEGREWPVHIIWRNWGGPDLTKGWPRFVKENNLKAGDICVFELIRKRDALMKVSVSHSR